MSFLKKLFGGGNPSMPKTSDSSDPNALWLYVQCAKCGAPVAIRVDTRNDISIDYETGGRYLRKEIMDSTCFQLMYADVRFDGNGRITEQDIQGGKFLTRDEYETVRDEFEAKRAARANS
jgi:hypothetical protein